MAIQIHQLNQITAPAMTDVLALDTGTDTGKVSVETLSSAVLADYEATFGEDTTDVISKVTAVATAQAADADNIATLQTDVSGKVNKSGDTMTGVLTITGTNQQRFVRINNGTRNVRLTNNADGNFGLYDDTADQTGWILRSTSGNSLLTTPAAFACGALTLSGHSSAVGSIIQASKTTATAVTSGSWTELQRITLPIGTWVIMGTITCSSTTASADSSKFFTLQLSTTSGYARQTVSLVSSVYSSGSVTDFYTTTTESTDVTMSAYVGTNCNIARSYLKAIRIV